MHAHALHAAVGRRGRPEEVVQRVGHLQARADLFTVESAAALSVESAAGVLTHLYLRRLGTAQRQAGGSMYITEQSALRGTKYVL